MHEAFVQPAQGLRVPGSGCVCAEVKTGTGVACPRTRWVDARNDTAFVGPWVGP